MSYFTHIFFSFFLVFLQTSYGFIQIKTYKLHYFYLSPETTNRCENTVTTTFFIRPRSLHFPLLQVYCLPTKFFCADRYMISFDFHHLGAFFRPELSRLPPYPPSFEGAILYSKLENVGPTLSSLLCAEPYA